MTKNPKSADLEPRERARIGPRQLKDPASVDYAWQTIALMKTRYQCQQLSIRDWEKVLEEARQYRIFERVPPEAPYGSLDALLRTEIGCTEAESRVNVRQRVQGAAENTTGEVLPRGNPTGANQHKQPEENRKLRNSSRATQAERAKANGVSKRTQEKLDALARQRPDLLKKVQAGEMSTHAAAVQAGIEKVKSPRQLAEAAFRQMSAEEADDFLAWCRENKPRRPRGT
jgi:hypothetical protein